jgi:hypothetical protein
MPLARARGGPRDGRRTGAVWTAGRAQDGRGVGRGRGAAWGAAWGVGRGRGAAWALGRARHALP